MICSRVLASGCNRVDQGVDCHLPCKSGYRGSSTVVHVLCERSLDLSISILPASNVTIQKSSSTMEARTVTVFC